MTVPTPCKPLLFLHAISLVGILFAGGNAKLCRCTQQVRWLGWDLSWCWKYGVHYSGKLVRDDCQQQWHNIFGVISNKRFFLCYRSSMRDSHNFNRRRHFQLSDLYYSKQKAWIPRRLRFLMQTKRQWDTLSMFCSTEHIFLSSTTSCTLMMRSEGAGQVLCAQYGLTTNFKSSYRLSDFCASSCVSEASCSASWKDCWRRPPWHHASIILASSPSLVSKLLCCLLWSLLGGNWNDSWEKASQRFRPSWTRKNWMRLSERSLLDLLHWWMLEKLTGSGKVYYINFFVDNVTHLIFLPVMKGMCTG